MGSFVYIRWHVVMKAAGLEAKRHKDTTMEKWKDHNKMPVNNIF